MGYFTGPIIESPKVSFWLPVFLDLLVLSSQIGVWLHIDDVWGTTRRYCNDEYVDNNDCVDLNGCDKDIWCTQYNTVSDSWGSSQTCSDDSCYYSCKCRPNKELKLTIDWYLFFMIVTFIIEGLKLIVALWGGRSTMCNIDDSDDISQSLLTNIADTAHVIILFIRVKKLKYMYEAHETGELRLFSVMKIIEILGRQAPLTICLYIILFRYAYIYNIWIWVWLFSFHFYVFALAKRFHYKYRALNPKKQVKKKTKKAAAKKASKKEAKAKDLPDDPDSIPEAMAAVGGSQGGITINNQITVTYEPPMVAVPVPQPGDFAPRLESQPMTAPYNPAVNQIPVGPGPVTYEEPLEGQTSEGKPQPAYYVPGAARPAGPTYEQPVTRENPPPSDPQPYYPSTSEF